MKVSAPALRCRQCGWPYEVGVDGLCEGCRKLKDNPDPLSTRTHLGRIPFKDMKQLDEPERFKMIADLLIKNPGKKIAVFVDCGDGHADKGDRYIRGIRAIVPTVKLVERKPGPVKEGETLVLLYEG